jgi:hypothetical protein
MENILSSERRARVLTVGVSALVSLYFLAALVAEPMRGFAASDVDGKVSVVVTATASALECTDANGDGNGDDENLALPNITVDGDSGLYNAARDIHCNVKSNNSAGYTLSWQVTTGSGGTSTGYMINEFEDTIAPFRFTNDGNDAETTTVAWPSSGEVDAGESAWGGRLSSTSSAFTEDNAAVDITSTEWGGAGSDGDSNEKWARVASDTSVAFASATTNTVDAGDDHFVGFRVEIGSTKQQPTGTYEVEVDFTTANDT